ncbi:MAG: hypothetical protein M3Y56_06850 [Armatimonadota bacterium]|nr:hypothetical protein [Armatimonadota bacterium]
MAQYFELLEREVMTLAVSLPANDVALARAALAGGAEALKVHINVRHSATGIQFGSVEEERTNLEAILETAGDTPVGIVTGHQTPLTRDEHDLLQSMGFDFLNLHAHDIPVWAWLDDTFPKLVAVDESYTSDDLIALNLLSPDGVEAAVIPNAGYGHALNVRDLARYQMLYDILDWPMVVPTQRQILPDEVPALDAIGVRGLTIGAVVTGMEADSIREATAAFRRAMDTTS